LLFFGEGEIESPLYYGLKDHAQSACHADPARTLLGADALAHTLCAVSAGALSPEQARRDIERWLAQQALVDIDVLIAA